YARILAEDDGGASCGIAQAFQDFDSAGLAGTVRAEQAEDFAFADAKADAANGFDVTVALDEIFDSNNGFGHKEKLPSLQQTEFPRLQASSESNRRSVES